MDEQHCVLIVQARMRSVRFPGKVLQKIMDKPLLGYLLERLKRVTGAHEIVVATTTNKADQEILTVAEDYDVSVFRGNEENVLDRYLQAARQHHADVVVRVTADCPLIDSQIIDKVISAFYQQNRPYDYVSNILERTYPRGMDVEVFSFQALEQASNHAQKDHEKEHVTPYIYRHPQTFRLLNVSQDEDQSRFRLCVDTKEDFHLIELLLKELYPTQPHFDLQSIIKVLKQHPQWVKVNQHIEQKKH